jgi:hypothetical protein
MKPSSTELWCSRGLEAALFNHHLRAVAGLCQQGGPCQVPGWAPGPRRYEQVANRARLPTLSRNGLRFKVLLGVEGPSYEGTPNAADDGSSGFRGRPPLFFVKTDGLQALLTLHFTDDGIKVEKEPDVYPV